MTDTKKYSVRVGKTSFAMKADLPKKEPMWLTYWDTEKVYAQSIEKKGKSFILHDGPPYANGHLHVGHALNKILKDVLLRSHRMMGAYAPYIPGWDCHGLPIEWKIEEAYKKQGTNKDDIPVLAFRQECRQYANQWIAIQTEEFKRLGIAADWENHYETHSYKAEASIVAELGKVLENKSLYRGLRPVLWSVVEKTALADAEVEYHDVNADAISVLFPIEYAKDPAWIGANIIIWTTTPWTIPANQALAYNDDIIYGLYTVMEVDANATITIGTRLVMAQSLASSVATKAGIKNMRMDATQKGLQGIIAHHPLKRHGFKGMSPALPGDFVSDTTGTGIVHIAPAHGEDDFRLAKVHNINPIHSVQDDGTYHKNIPLMSGGHIFKANNVVIDALKNAGKLLSHEKITHSYPHSWRSKAPLIYRATPQWFISMDNTGLRTKALKEIEHTTFIPEKGKNRLKTMVENRPDWCISRQRTWGVPIAIFIHKETMEPLINKEIMNGIIEAFKKEGADAWFTGDAKRFLPSQYNKDDYEPIMDILDVWFESGTTHALLYPEGQKADYYVEGSDQHRGWFQSSLLESCATKGHAPYNAILTHGFVLDGQGQKMSKSIGNVITPLSVVKEYGADILRLWVVRSDYHNDVRISKAILEQTAEEYRRIRNTLRFLLANITVPHRAKPVTPLPTLAHYVLEETKNKAKTIETALKAGQIRTAYEILYTWCNEELSALYLDIWKDKLYCDDEKSTDYQGIQYVLSHIFETLVQYLAPIIPFTAEEAYKTRHGEAASSIHIKTIEPIEVLGVNKEDSLAITTIKEKVRPAILKAIESLKMAKEVQTSMQVDVWMPMPAEIQKHHKGIIQEMLMVADVHFNDTSDTMSVAKSSGEKCPRCWKYHHDKTMDNLCSRCDACIRAES